MLKADLSALTFLLLLCSVVGLGFDLTSGKVKCFSEDVPEKTLVVGTYSMDEVPEGQNRMPTDIQVSDPMEKTIYSQEDAKEGKFAFTSTVAGDYIVCFHNKGLSEFNTQRRVKLDIKHGIDAKDYSQVMKTEHLSKVQTIIRELEDRTVEIRDEMRNHKSREESFRDLSEVTCERVVWFALFTITVLVGKGVFEGNYLHNYFKRNKII